MKRLLLLPLLLALVLANACSNLAVAAATVNGQKITDADVEAEVGVVRNDPVFGDRLRRDPEERGGDRRQVLSQLIYETVAGQQAESRGIRPTVAQSDRLLDQNARQEGLSVDEYLEVLNLTLGEARTIAERIVRRFALIEEVVEHVDISDEIVREVYEVQREQFNEVHLERITVPTVEDAQNVREAASSGSFAELARTSSIDDLATRGGDMGFIPLTSLSSDVQDAVTPIDVGAITVPVQVPSGFEIYKLVDRRSQTIEEVAGEIREALSQQQRNTLYQRWLVDRVREADVVVNPKYGRFDATGDQPGVVAAEPAA